MTKLLPPEATTLLEAILFIGREEEELLELLVSVEGLELGLAFLLMVEVFLLLFLLLFTTAFVVVVVVDDEEEEEVVGFIFDSEDHFNCEVLLLLLLLLSGPDVDEDGVGPSFDRLVAPPKDGKFSCVRAKPDIRLRLIREGGGGRVNDTC